MAFDQQQLPMPDAAIAEKWRRPAPASRMNTTRVGGAAGTAVMCRHWQQREPT